MTTNGKQHFPKRNKNRLQKKRLKAAMQTALGSIAEIDCSKYQRIDVTIVGTRMQTRVCDLPDRLGFVTHIIRPALPLPERKNILVLRDDLPLLELGSRHRLNRKRADSQLT